MMRLESKTYVAITEDALGSAERMTGRATVARREMLKPDSWLTTLKGCLLFAAQAFDKDLREMI